MRRLVRWGAAVIAAMLLALLTYRGLVRTNVAPQFAGTCRALPLAAGAGDISIDQARGVAYLAYLDRTPSAEGKAPRGTIMLVDLKAAEPRVRAALNTDPPDFRPTALSLYAPARGPRRLFVIDAGESSPAVEIFEQSATGAFSPIKTVRDPLLVNPSAIVATGPEQFYVTTDASGLDPSASSLVKRWWQLTFPTSQSSVVMYDGERMKTVATQLRTAMGITTSPDAALIYVGELARKRVRVFARDATTGGLTAHGQIDLPSLPHHLHGDVAGDIWIAAHPRIADALKSNAGTVARTATQALKVAVTKGAVTKGNEVRLIFQDDGRQLAGATAVAAYQHALIIGSWIDRRLLLCDQTQ